MGVYVAAGSQLSAARGVLGQELDARAVHPRSLLAQRLRRARTGDGVTTLICPSAVRPEQLKQALQECESIAAKDRSNLYVTSQFFEDRARYDAFIAMYAVM